MPGAESGGPGAAVVEKSETGGNTQGATEQAANPAKDLARELSQGLQDPAKANEPGRAGKVMRGLAARAKGLFGRNKTSNEQPVDGGNSQQEPAPTAPGTLTPLEAGLAGGVIGGDGAKSPDTVTDADTSLPGTKQERTDSQAPKGTEEEVESATETPKNAEKTAEQRQQEIKDTLTALGMESKIDTPEVQDALKDPDKMEQLEKMVELTKSTVDNVIALAEGNLSPEAISKLAESQFNSIKEALQDAAKKVDASSEKGKKLNWLILLLAVLAAPAGIAAVGAAAAMKGAGGTFNDN